MVERREKGGSLFCRAPYLEQEARRIFRELEQEQYLPREVKQAAGLPQAEQHPH
jgi:fido (protein-threonine AMPylation protein)